MNEVITVPNKNANDQEGKAAVTADTLRVSGKSKPNSVAGAVAGLIREKGHVEIQTIGAGALNQAVKAVCIARGFLAPSGIEISMVPAFCDVSIDGAERTAIRLLIKSG